MIGAGMVSAPILAVSDTAILVSAIVTKKDPIAHLLNAVITGQVEIVLSPYIVRELRQTLATKRDFRDRVTDDEREAYIARLEAVATVIAPRYDIHGVVADPNDDPIISLAVSAHVAYLVTGDKALLAVKTYQEIRIVTAREFFAILNPAATP